MGSLHQLHRESRIDIHAQNEIFQHFSGVHFEDFVGMNAIEIQSTRTQRNGKVAKNSPRRLAQVWEMHLRRYLGHKDINIAQMLKNYHEKTTTMNQKRAIYFKLKEIGTEGLDPQNELEYEALMLGIAMMLSDSLEIQLSLIHAFENGANIHQILEQSEGFEQKALG